jgi:hypothetical protein
MGKNQLRLALGEEGDSMRSTLAVILAVLTVGLLGSAACADPVWTDCSLAVYGHSETVTLTPTFEQSGDVWIYTYVLKNTSNPYRVQLAGFTLTLPSTVPVSSVTELAHPAGWQFQVLFNQLDWQNWTGSDIGYGGTGTFKFSTKFGPSLDKQTDASTNDALGFTGKCYSPIPEPASLVALLAGIGGLVGLKKRRTA